MKKTKPPSLNLDKYVDSDFSEFETESSKQESESLEKERIRNEETAQEKHKWDGITRVTVRTGMLVTVSIIFSVVGGAIFTLGWHMLTPEEYAWLTDEKISNVKSFILSGALVSAGMAYFKRFIEL